MLTVEELLLVFVVVLGALSVLLYLVPKAYCEKCPHCREETKKYKEKQEKSRHDYEHQWFGLKNCPTCNKEK